MKERIKAEKELNNLKIIVDPIIDEDTVFLMTDIPNSPQGYFLDIKL